MELYVKALPVEEIITDLAEKLDLPVERDANELCINLTKEVGYGIIRGTGYSSGIGVIEFYCTFIKDLTIHFEADKHPLKFLFCSKGKADHSFEEEEIVHTLETYQSSIVACSGGNGHVLYFNANEIVHLTSLEITRDRFEPGDEYNYEGLHPRLKAVFEDKEAENMFFYEGNYSIDLADIVEEIHKKSQSGFARSMFVKAKLYEMLSRQILQFHADQATLPLHNQKSDVEKVKQAVRIIKKELNRNFSVNYLAKEVGTNVNKLQEAFKYMFGLTVNKYMQQVKLEAAKNLLMTSDHNISQIVSKIGLNNRSYFSKVFKEKYGVSPKYFLKTRNDAEDEI